MKVSLHNRVILLVECDQSCQQFFQSCLKKTGARVLAVDSGYEAIDLLQDDYVKVDVIFTCVSMPYMSGFEMAQTIRQRNDRYKDIPIIAWTSSWLSIGSDDALKGLFNQCLSKPTLANDLIGSAAKFLQVEQD